MRTALAVALTLAACTLVGACKSGRGGPEPALGRIAGRVIADPLPADARIEIHRRDDFGLASPVVGFDVRPDRTGQFRSEPLPQGRYLIVLRSLGIPPAVVNVRVPQEGTATLQAALPAGSATIVLTAPPSRPESLRCRLVAPEAEAGVLDVREVILPPGESVVVHGIEPGRWKLDAVNSAATTELDVGAGPAPQHFVVDPPLPAPSDTGVEGVVEARDGRPARGVVVSAWSLSADGVHMEVWGRQSEVGPDGSFAVAGLRPGKGMVRVELRGASHRLLPPPETIQIPPSGRLRKSFRVDP